MSNNSVNKRYVPKLRFREFDGEYSFEILNKYLEYEQPTKYLILNNKNINEIGNVPVLTANKSFILGYVENELNNCYKKGECFIFDDFTTDIKYVNFLFKLRSSAAKIITTKNDNYINYFFYLLKSKKPETSGHKRHWIEITSKEKRFIPPTLKEQEKISIFLSLLDKQISLLENKLKLTERMKKYYLYKMINIGNKFLIRFNEFKDYSIENAQLTSLVKLNKYKQISASELEQLNSKSGNIKLLPSSKDFDWFSDLVDIKDNRVNYGNVITLGRARYANIKKWKGHFISSNNIIIENNNNVVFDYLYHLINKNKKKFYIEKTTYPVFSSEIFKEFDCSIPSNINEQIKISDFLNKIEWIELHIKNKIELTKKRKLFYLNNLFI